jgi:hypothetical protein
VNKAIDQMHDKNIILIRGAGNSFPDYKESIQGNPKNSILVGSLSPYGIPSFYSNDAPEGVFQVFAPSDNSIYSSYEDKPYKFGGTSGAQPLVCGATANVLSLLPGISANEIMELIKQSAVKLPSISEQKHNSQGMINAYKLAKMAERLAMDWPRNRATIFSDGSLSNFKQEVTPLIQEAKKYQPYTNVCQRRSALALLRRAFLLEPNPEVAQTIAQIYRNAGLHRMATFYANYKTLDLKALEAMYRDGGNDRVLAAGAIRSAYEIYGRDSLPLLRDALQNGGSTDVTKTAMVGMSKILPKHAAMNEAFMAFNKQSNAIGMRGIMFAAKNELKISLQNFAPLIQEAKVSKEAKEMLMQALEDDSDTISATTSEALEKGEGESRRKGK